MRCKLSSSTDRHHGVGGTRCSARIGRVSYSGASLDRGGGPPRESATGRPTCQREAAAECPRPDYSGTGPSRPSPPPSPCGCVSRGWSGLWFSPGDGSRRPDHRRANRCWRSPWNPSTGTAGGRPPDRQSLPLCPFLKKGPQSGYRVNRGQDPSDKEIVGDFAHGAGAHHRTGVSSSRPQEHRTCSRRDGSTIVAARCVASGRAKSGGEGPAPARPSAVG